MPRCDDAVVVGVDDGRGSVPQIQLDEDAPDVTFHGQLGNAKLLSDFGVGAALADQPFTRPAVQRDLS